MFALNYLLFVEYQLTCYLTYSYFFTSPMLLLCLCRLVISAVSSSKSWVDTAGMTDLRVCVFFVSSVMSCRRRMRKMP